jgi:hypothetical protein
VRLTSGWAAVCSSRSRFIAVLDVFVNDTISVEVGRIPGNRRSTGFDRSARGEEVLYMM